VSHSTLVVARVSQVKLHVPIKDNDLDMNINKITEYLEHGYNEILTQNHIKQ
jgi:translation initiation factor IF-3